MPKIKFLAQSIQKLQPEQTDRQTHRHTDRQTHRQTDRQTDTQTDRQAGRHTDRQTDRQRDRQAERQTDRQTDRQRGERKANKENEGEGENNHQFCSAGENSSIRGKAKSLGTSSRCDFKSPDFQLKMSKACPSHQPFRSQSVRFSSVCRFRYVGLYLSVIFDGVCEANGCLIFAYEACTLRDR